MWNGPCGSRDLRQRLARGKRCFHMSGLCVRPRRTLASMKSAARAAKQRGALFGASVLTACLASGYRPGGSSSSFAPWAPLGTLQSPRRKLVEVSLPVRRQLGSFRSLPLVCGNACLWSASRRRSAPSYWLRPRLRPSAGAGSGDL